MGSALLSTPMIAPTNLDRHQILRNFCHELVRKGLKAAQSQARHPTVASDCRASIRAVRRHTCFHGYIFWLSRLAPLAG